MAEKRLQHVPAYLEYYCAYCDNTKPFIYTCKGIVSPLTCWLGSGEDKLGGAAALDLSIASVNVNAVNCERLQAGDLQLTLRH